MPRRRGYNPDQESLFPELVDRPHYKGTFGPNDPAWLELEREQRAWYTAWEREHPPPPRRCHFCGQPGGTIWLTFLDERGGPNPCHAECAALDRKQRLGEDPAE